MSKVEFTRTVQSIVDEIFPRRWSPRSFDAGYRLSREELNALLEAALWAPSCFNEQPWFFRIALQGSPSFLEFLKLLNESNREWAQNASLLMFVVGKKHFEKNAKENPTFEFDCGAAWMSFTLQARILELYTHGMAGFDREAAARFFEIDTSKEKVIAAVAAGKKEDSDKLPEKLRAKEKMSGRKDLKDIYKLYE